MRGWRHYIAEQSIHAVSTTNSLFHELSQPPNLRVFATISPQTIPRLSWRREVFASSKNSEIEVSRFGRVEFYRTKSQTRCDTFFLSKKNLVVNFWRFTPLLPNIIIDKYRRPNVSYRSVILRLVIENSCRTLLCLKSDAALRNGG